MTAHQLFQPFRLKSLELKNRIVMAPMTRSFSPGGVPGSDVADYYARRAEGEVGLILSEGTVVNRPASSYDPNIPHFYGKKPLRGWKSVIDKVHAAGGVMAPQLWHVGVVPPKDSGWVRPGSLRRGCPPGGGKLAGAAPLRLHQMRPSLGRTRPNPARVDGGLHPTGMRREPAPAQSGRHRPLSNPLAGRGRE